jgi:hypothetical protein
MANFRKILKYKVKLKPVQWELSCSMLTDGRTKRNDQANSRFSQFCEQTKNWLINQIKLQKIYYLKISALESKAMEFSGKGIVKVTPLQTRLWPRGRVNV